jgi:NADPH-dependent 7-cyano-7-deazaguanine reductase QueF-like protein
VAQSGTLRFEPGQTSKTIAIVVSGDTVLESDEQFKVVLSGASAAKFKNSEAIGTIINDDNAAAAGAALSSGSAGNS